MGDVTRFWCHEASNIRCVRESDFDAALAREAALREELANVKARRDLTLADLNRADDIRSDLQQRLTAAEQRNAELDLEWSRTITDRGLIALELNKAKQLLRDVLDEVPHGWGESFSESDLADRIRQAIPMRFCDACEQYVEGPCSSWDCSTPEVENWTKPTESGASE